MHGLLDLLAWTCATVGVLGLLMRYGVRDRVPALAAVFYALPPLVMVMLFVVSLGLSLLRPRRPRRAKMLGLLTMMALGVWIQTDFVWVGAVEKATPSLRVVLWNLARPSGTDESFIPVLQETDAQILFLVESGGHTMARQEFWMSHFPNHHVRLFAGQMALLSMYPIANARCTAVGEGTRIVECDLILSGGTLSVVAADVASTPCSGRKRPLDRICAVAGSKRGPALVLGDFNTPHTSVLFDELRLSFSHAFEEAGAGLITTWPSLFPVLALDHIWLSEELAAVRTVLCRTRYSDHALVIADIAIESSGKSEEVVTVIDV